MKEGLFLKKNKKKWEKIEEETRQIEQLHPDRLGEIFIELADDLSYARTHHTKSPVTKYLNALTARVHQSIYKQQNIRWEQISNFWKQDLPLTLAQSRKAILVSFVIFAISTLIGVVSVLNDQSDYEFARGILSDRYVDMTLRNIKEGNPMGVYQEQEPIKMFLGIAYNNIRVAFVTFVWGGSVSIVGIPAFLLLSIGTAYVLFVNGVMLGTFQTLFFKENLLWESAGVIWLHGTIEIWSIVMAGAAGIVMGNSIFFPQTYTRRDSFRRGAEKGGKIMLGLVPFFLIAAFIESFVTRYADMPWLFKLLIIFGSLALVIHYFVVYPYFVEKKLRSASRNEKI
ncbi:MAG: stage II sporulation protein M [Raineya sp.]